MTTCSRALAKVSLSFGLVQIPVKVYLAAAEAEPHTFRMLSPLGNRVRQKLVDEATEKEVAYSDTQRGIEVEKDKFVTFTEAEWDELYGHKKNLIEMSAVVPSGEITWQHCHKTYHLTPDSSDRPYRILHVALLGGDRVVVSRWYTNQGVDHLVILYPTSDHIMMGQVFYHDELRQVNLEYAGGTEPTPDETKLGKALLDKLATPTLDWPAHRPEFDARLAAAVEAKRASHYDLKQLLKKSLSHEDKAREGPGRVRGRKR